MAVLKSSHIKNRQILNLSGEELKVGRRSYYANQTVLTSKGKFETDFAGVLPGRVPGKILIVSKEIATKHPERDDLIFIEDVHGRKKFHTAWKNFQLRKRLPTTKELRYSFWSDFFRRKGRGDHRTITDSIGLSRLERLRLSSKDQQRTLTNIAYLVLHSPNAMRDFRKILRDIDPAAAFGQRLRELRRQVRGREENYGITDGNTRASIKVSEMVTVDGNVVSQAEGYNNLTGEAFRTTGGDFHTAKKSMAKTIQHADDLKSSREENMRNVLDQVKGSPRGANARPSREKTAEKAHEMAAMERGGR